MKKRNIILILVMLFLFQGIVKAEDDYAQKLNTLGLFKGTEKGYELDREPTRIEGLIFMIRLLGEEEKALQYSAPSPFTDVPKWAIPYVAYANEKGWAKGIGNSLFQPTKKISYQSFLTFLLRGMGYQDKGSHPDFSWDQPELLTMSLSLCDTDRFIEWESRPFLRKDAVKLIYTSLTSQTKSGEKLAESLLRQSVFTKDTAITAGITFGNISAIETAPAQPIASESNNTDSNNEKPYFLVGPPTATGDQIYRWARSKGMNEEGLSLIDLYFEICQKKGLNPVIQYAQMCHETGFLYRDKKSLAGLDASYHNPCGLKITQGGDGYVAASHQKFKDWREGIEAHTDHTALYAGVSGYPKADTPDPRHFKYLKGTATMLADLSGKWAPASDYHLKIYKMIQQIEKM